ncbi:Maf family protein [Cellvibrio japonicus]|uniref:7-methyl-GTP pyrophosphatase n=1 Tax=Cellvibrio japonicus (strain Ueda107) TaxID=498211 RepID=B3PEU6_CELJU|nr:Maf family nucleotide pyrophosphatase [Cellvibrio japonicus]ACE84228.1 septum formation protein Maf [Cellvibrio japonicus Ueda107]QEI12194.1 septum formation inhibitor Maf [Cellvibrio japonicus]QEI15768.1 septum formation inhibitor Maf [Cellvibrio japonicus]QEI19346.1 septum formation inhibitor Maf [Cellvibrio japonicus]
MKKILLASSSIYRRRLLEKLELPFETANPAIDETPAPRETPAQLVERLACAKASALVQDYPDHVIIGSDQVASFEGKTLGKPLHFEAAFQQLCSFRGKSVTFFTGLCLLNPENNTRHTSVETCEVHFRTLSDIQITHYLHREQPYDCAGSFKSEGLGISLFEKVTGDDPNTLVGLPLIALIRMLYKEGIDPLG